MVLWDGSPHRWFGKENPFCGLAFATLSKKLKLPVSIWSAKPPLTIIARLCKGLTINKPP